MPMKELSADSWKRQGSSVIWDKDTLQSLLPVASLVSLRTFLSWHDAWPAQLRGNSRTILVGGLQTCLELLSPAVGQRFERGYSSRVAERSAARSNRLPCPAHLLNPHRIAGPNHPLPSPPAQRWSTKNLAKASSLPLSRADSLASFSASLANAKLPSRPCTTRSRGSAR